MEDVMLSLDENGNGTFTTKDDMKQLGEMVVRLSGKHMTVYHTEVSPKAEGKGLAKPLLATRVDYARKNKLKVIPLCPYVHAQFKRNPDMYADVWEGSFEKEEKPS